jgi:DNA-binding IclR family transcriptional regulator
MKPKKQQRGVADPRPRPERPSREALRFEGARWRLTAVEDVSSIPAAPGLVPALENAIAIIEFLNRTEPHTASLVEISSSLSISKSHCHSILKTLTHYGWLKFDQRVKTYQLYSGILSSASAVWRNPSLDAIRERLSAIPGGTGAPCTLAQPQGDDSFVLMYRFSAVQMEVSLPIGHRYPRDAAAHMRAYVAWQPEERLAAWFETWRPIAYTSLSLVTPEAVRCEIAATRLRGYARSAGEFTDGLMALALPIFDRDGEVAFVVSCASLMTMVEPIEEQVASEMIRAVVDIHRATLARPPAGFHR